MSGINTIELQNKMDAIVKEYLFNVSSLGNHDYFNQRKAADSRTKYYKDIGFSLLTSQSENSYVVKEETFLEGCTRVFLINPILKVLMDEHGIQNDWQNGHTFADYDITNREYELGSYVEFIAVLDGKNVGVRYTKASYSSTEIYAMNKDFQYLYGNDKVPGFDNLSHVDEVYVLDWSGISEDELSKLHPFIPGRKQLTTDMTVEKLFHTYFSEKAYELVVQATTDAIANAKSIVALNAVPQLLPNNILNFKQVLLNDFTEDKLESLKYEFKDGSTLDALNEADTKIIKDTFFGDGYREALIGEADFAKSFITSEYLFRTVKEGLIIDYTSVVVGYLKSVEQLLYLLYLSAFEGSSYMFYWDRCNNPEIFDESNKNKYRYDPYNLETGWMQAKFRHRKKTGDGSPEIGELTRFLRYYDKMWNITENGKELIFSCLEDFRHSCRNSHFHKDNIGSNEYFTVERISKDTRICLYYLLGGFKVLDSSTSAKEQLGIIDYSFECLYQEIYQKRRRFFNAKFSDGEETVICYLNDDIITAFNETGVLANAELRFVKTRFTRENSYISDINQIMGDESYVKVNTISITRKNMPTEMTAFQPKKKPIEKKAFLPETK